MYLPSIETQVSLDRYPGEESGSDRKGGWGWALHSQGRWSYVNAGPSQAAVQVPRPP